MKQFVCRAVVSVAFALPFGSQAQESRPSAAAALTVPAATAGPVHAAEMLSTTEVFDPDAPTMNREITHTRYPNVPLLSTGSALLVTAYLPLHTVQT